ncbi:MAG: cell division protein FtsQ/DivIB [Rhodospirillales bacterium]|nr:cell division protein FtsQ/DivIB [Rhodospirillales bacterium]
MSRVRRSPRNSIKDRPRRLRLLLRRQKSRIRLLAIVAAAGLLIGLPVLIRVVAPARNLVGMRERFGNLAALVGFRIDHVIIRGQHNTPAPLLDAALGVTDGDPTFGFSLSAARRRIESLAWVRSVVIERRLPGTIVVVLTERRPYALWQHDGHFSVIDRRGDTVAEHDVRAFRNLPLVVGPGAPVHAKSLIESLAHLPTIARRVAASVRVGERRWNLVLKDGTTVELPGGHATVALARLADLDAKYALLDRPLAVIDMRLADRLVVRPWPQQTTPSTNPSGQSG